MPAQTLENADSTEERKRLGQFFTGEPLARLLAALAEADSARAVIDPMAGSGDMLVAVRQVGSTGSVLTAVEIDPIAASACSTRLRSKGQPESTIRIGDAFSIATWADLKSRAWDLVITNPPYVRYQRSTHRGAGRIALPSATDVRSGLRAILDARTILSRKDRQVFGALATAYSGHADLAVPAWILCATLVATGGRLAMVVPDTWLTRDYALPVLYLLRRYFEIEFVIEDGEAAWFEDALVRTTLLVARRVEDRGTALHEADTGHLHVRLDRVACDARSVVGTLYAESPAPEHDFAATLRQLRRSRGVHRVDGLSAEWVSDQHLREIIATHSRRSAWISALEPNLTNGPRAEAETTQAAHLPRQVRELAPKAPLDVRTVADYGWRVGQGLRTGANRFFYGECISHTEATALLAIDPALGLEPLPVPTELVRTVVRKQRDLITGRGLPANSPGRVLVLTNLALPEDCAASERLLGMSPHQVIPEPLAEHLRRAAQLDVGSPNDPRRLPELSAVVTNVRRIDLARPDRPPRFWYQLPSLAARHVPDLLIPRINHLHPRVVMNRPAVVIDANFSTMWRANEDALTPNALLALMRSAWVLAVLEASATVLGGGALKVEATHLRRLPLPNVETVRDHLDRLGGHLAVDSGRDEVSVCEEIDDLVWSALLGSKSPTSVRRAAEQIGPRLMNLRNPRAVEGCDHLYQTARPDTASAEAIEGPARG